MFPSDTENKFCVLLRPAAAASERTFQLGLRSLTDEPHAALTLRGSDGSIYHLKTSN